MSSRSSDSAAAVPRRCHRDDQAEEDLVPPSHSSSSVASVTSVASAATDAIADAVP